jgi:hypothetical protein
MVDFEYWFDGIIGTCELIADRDVFEHVWVFGDKTVTSIHYPDELFEQLLGDLNVEENVEYFRDRLKQMGVFEAVVKFTAALLEVEKANKIHPDLRDPKSFLRSDEWARVKLAAQQLIDLPTVTPFRNRKTHIEKTARPRP